MPGAIVTSLLEAVLTTRRGLGINKTNLHWNVRWVGGGGGISRLYSSMQTSASLAVIFYFFCQLTPMTSMRREGMT